MAVFKRCRETGCTTAPRCPHPWSLELMVNGHRERGPLTNYLDHWPTTRPLPRNQTEAEDLELLVKAWMKRGRPPLPPRPGAPTKTGPTIADACDVYLTGHIARMRDSSAPGMVARITREFGDRPLADLLDRPLVRDFLAEIEQDTSGVNANRFRSRWSHLINFCRAEFALAGVSPFFHRSANPAGLRKYDEGAPRDRRLQPGEEDALVAACTAIADGGMMLGRFYCAIDCGLRRGEMLAMRREDVVREKTGAVHLRVRWSTSKTKRERRVPVQSPRLGAWLERRRFTPFVFGQADGTRLESFRTEWDTVLIAAGLSAGEWLGKGNWRWTKDADLHWHDLRHECGSRLAEGGVPVTEIMALLGHTNLSTTQRYVNPTLASLTANMKRVQQGLV